MKYVGNTALSPQIQERIQSTFSQTLSLAEEGNRQEALLGCDFILRLDPLFEPARRLQERLNSGEGPVSVDGLMDSSTAPAPETTTETTTEADEAPLGQLEPVEEPSDAPLGQAEPIEEASVDIAELIADTPSDDVLLTDDALSAESPETLVSPTMETEVEAPAPQVESPALEPERETVEASETTPVDDVAGRIAMLFEQRNFEELIALAGENQDLLTDDPELMQMAQQATERLEAEPYVRNFLDSAQAAKEKDDVEGARSYLEKARELDASHPSIAQLESDLEAASKVEPPEAFEPQPLPEPPPPVDTAAARETEDELFKEIEEPSADLAAETEIPSLSPEPAARLDSESEQRIDQLLKEGQQSFEDGQYQAAIDAWSRIFLIDIDHSEASRRIELARKLKAEVERQIEEAFHEGISLLESGDQDQAREAFEKVLEIQPNHMGASDYLEKLEAGSLQAGPTPAPDLTPLPEDDTVAEVEAFESSEALEMAPAATEDEEVGLPTVDFETPAKAAPRRRSFALIGTAVLFLVLAAGWFVYSNWDRFFPASAPDADATTAAAQVDPIERALELHEAGNTPMAINVLRRLNPGHDKYSEAQALITMWEAGQAPAEPVSEAPTEEQLAFRTELLRQADGAMARGENLLALDLIEEASQIAELDEEELELQTRADTALALLEDERDLFEQGDWEYALPNLWRIHDADPDNQDAIRLMVDSYYNLGLRDLQRGDAKSALEKFEEAQGLAGEDEALERLVEFASAYTQRPADMLFRIFVKYQRFR